MENSSGKRLPLEIRVTGRSKLSRQAERCVLTMIVTSSGENQETVSTDVITTTSRLKQLFKDLALKTESGLPTPDAPITTLSISRLHNGSFASVDRNNKPLPRTYTTRVTFEATFRDFQKLSEIGGTLLSTPLVEIQATNWKLTDQTRDRLETEARHLALRDAIQKAEGYAQVLGRDVVPVELRDGDAYQTYGMKQGMARNYHLSESSNKGIALEPEDVELIVGIEVKFVSVE